ncbi:methylmalonyl-CoA epimerase [candidate division KSB1 bacterium]|nr:methylmalonyl-CoA epimerase [candidate division KSB1 bacterium]
MLKQIDHIGIAVKNLNQQIEFYSNMLGLTCSGIEDVPEQKVRVGIFKLGNVRIELLEPTTPDSPIAKFMENRGEGIHHIGYAVENIEQHLKSLEEKNVRLIDSTPRIGAGGHKIAFLHPKATFGVLTELCEHQHVTTVNGGE